MTGVVTLISDPRVVGIPIADCGEPLVDLRDGASGEGLQLDARKQDEAGIWLNVRVGVAEGLRRAQAARTWSRSTG